MRHAVFKLQIEVQQPHRGTTPKLYKRHAEPLHRCLIALRTRGIVMSHACSIWHTFLGELDFGTGVCTSPGGDYIIIGSVDPISRDGPNIT